MDGGIEQNPAYGTAQAYTYRDYVRCEDAERVVEVVGRVARALGVPFALGRDEASVSASIGVAFFDGMAFLNGVAFLEGMTFLDGITGREAEELVREADRAMYRAKGEEGARY